MPMIDDGSGNLVNQVLFLAQMARQRDQQQGSNQINTATPGQTVADVGMSPRQFAAMFGKDTPYDPKRVLRDSKASDILDTNLKNFINSADPATLASFSASAMLNRSGIAGLTTPEGLKDAIKTGGRAAQTAEQVSAATQPEAVRTGIAHAKTGAVQAESAQATAESVAKLIDKGIQSMSRAPEEVQAAAGQTAAYGTTASAIQSGELKNQIAISSLREAINAQTDQKAPIHSFLAKNGLDLHTVLAGSAMGLTNLFDNYTRMLMTVKATNKEMELAMLRSQLETARDMSMKVFGGKLTPNQVLAVIKAKEKGGPVPKGLEDAAKVYDYGVQASYQAAIAAEIEKGDPMIAAARAQIQALQAPGMDPNNLSAVRDLSRTIAAIAMTKSQIGDPPSDPAERAKWDQVFQLNKNRVPGTGIKFPIFSRGSSVDPAGLGSQRAPTMAPAGSVAPTSTPLSVKPVGAVSAAGGILAPAGGPAPSGTATNQPSGDLSAEDQKAVTDYLKSLGMIP